MKIAVASNIVIDFIHDVKGRISRNLGGPACYCGLTARQFGFEVRLATKVGTDFCVYHKEFLHDHGIALKGDQITEYPTTKFKVLVNEDDSRDLFLLSKCIPLTEDDIEEIDTDSWLVTPVIDEVPVNVLKQ